ncbi:MAG TPA: ComEC/Rec2 family competence protein [Candidatus Paceibacterota bacterium]
MEHNIKKIFFTTLAIIAAIFIFWWRFSLAQNEIKLARNDLRLGEEVVIAGIINNDPEKGDKNIKFVLKSKDDRRYLVTAELGKEFHYGEKIIVSGKLARPEKFTTDNGREFDYVHYLAKDKVYYLIKYPEIEMIGEAGNPIKKVLFQIKNSLLDSIEKILVSPESTLLGGLLLGEDAKFTDELNDQFIRTGTIHIVALSGFNVTIVAEAIMKFFKLFLSQIWSISLGIISIILFAIMTGAGSTIIRASIMAILALIARATGRTYAATRALLLAGFFMVILNPMILFYDVSFQLSFIATFGIINLAPRMEKYFKWLPKILDLPSIAATTAAAYIFVLPFLLYKMGVLSLVALPANILILPFIPLTMLFGFIAGLLGLISTYIALPFSFLSHLLLGYELGIIKWFSSFDFAAINIGQFSLVLVVLIYLFYLWIIFRKKKLT